MIVSLINETCIQLKIDSSIYSSEVVHKCFYWYIGKYSVEINLVQNYFLVTFSSLNKDMDVDSIVNKIKIDLIDFKTREVIFKETKNIREMLIAKAFSNNDEFDEHPPGNINDPVEYKKFKL